MSIVDFGIAAVILTFVAAQPADCNSSQSSEETTALSSLVSYAGSWDGQKVYAYLSHVGECTCSIDSSDSHTCKLLWYKIEK